MGKIKLYSVNLYVPAAAAKKIDGAAGALYPIAERDSAAKKIVKDAAAAVNKITEDAASAANTICEAADAAALKIKDAAGAKTIDVAAAAAVAKEKAAEVYKEMAAAAKKADLASEERQVNKNKQMSDNYRRYGKETMADYFGRGVDWIAGPDTRND